MYHPSTSIYLPTYLPTNQVVTNLSYLLIIGTFYIPYQLNHGDAYGLIVTNVVRVFGLIVLKPRGLGLGFCDGFRV
jgi:hypothetical protein